MLWQVNAAPGPGPPQALGLFAAFPPVMGSSFALQLVTGATPWGTFAAQAQCALQQSQ
jgi:hypothetical protein